MLSKIKKLALVIIELKIKAWIKKTLSHARTRAYSVYIISCNMYSVESRKALNLGILMI